MKIRLLTVTHKLPSWLQAGYEDYAKRMPASCALELVEVPAEKRSVHADIKRLMEKEGAKIESAIKRGHHVIALDVKGKLWSTEQLAEQLNHWLKEGQNIDLLIGGPDGLSPACVQKANQVWSLSPLTFPHFLVRLIIAEQIYRAHSLLKHHPYHR